MGWALVSVLIIFVPVLSIPDETQLPLSGPRRAVYCLSVRPVVVTAVHQLYRRCGGGTSTKMLIAAGRVHSQVMRAVAEETHTTDSPEATMAVAATLAGRLVAGDVVVLAGELGSGKSVFVRGAAAALGYDGPVTSPTFAIGNVYSGGRCEIAHLDLYRLAEIDVADEAVLDDFLTPGRIGFVEWPHDELAGERALRAVVQLEHAGADRRRINVRWIESEAAA